MSSSPASAATCLAVSIAEEKVALEMDGSCQILPLKQEFVLDTCRTQRSETQSGEAEASWLNDVLHAVVLDAVGTLSCILIYFATNWSNYDTVQELCQTLAHNKMHILPKCAERLERPSPFFLSVAVLFILVKSAMASGLLYRRQMSPFTYLSSALALHLSVLEWIYLAPHFQQTAAFSLSASLATPAFIVLLMGSIWMAKSMYSRPHSGVLAAAAGSETRV